MKMFSIIAAVILSLGITAQARQITLTPDNTVTIRTEISYGSTSEAALELMKLVAKRGTKSYPIYLVLDSPGGSIDAGNDFVEFVKTVPNVHTVTLFAASMASAIVQQLPGKRLIVDSGISMYHRASGGFDGQFEDGELESRLGLYKDIVRNMEQKNADRMKLPLATYKALVKDELWILGKDALKRNVADEIVTVGCSAELLAQTKTITMQIFVFTIDVQFNQCPLIKAGTVTNAADRAQYAKFINQKQLRYIWKK